MKGLPRSTSRAAPQLAPIRKHRVTKRAAALEVDGATGVGFGTVVVGDFPQGNILFLGAAAYLQVTETDAGISDTFSGDYGVGTTPASDGTLTGGDVDIIPSTALGPAVSSVTPRTRGASAAAQTGVILDNTDGSLEVNLNVLVDDADISADDATATFDLDLVMSYVMLDDD